MLGLRLTLALAALCLLVVAGGMRLLLPAERGIAELVAGVGAALVAIPVFVEAWASLRHPEPARHHRSPGGAGADRRLGHRAI